MTQFKLDSVFWKSLPFSFIQRRICLQFELNQMGVICHNVQSQSFGKLEVALDTSTRGYYEPAAVQDVPLLQKKIQEIIQTHEKFHSFAEGKELLKHKAKDLYYFGDWDINGYPKGNGIQYKTGQYLYYGQFDSVPSGKGVYESYAQKFIYEGELSYGRIQGKGRVQSTDNLYSFEGQFNKNSEPITGTLRINDPEDGSKSYTVILNNYPEQKAKINYNDGREYLGEISYQNFAPQGAGMALFVNGSTYQGTWQNGEYHGKGKFTWTDGSYYLGEYQHGKKKGYGSFHYSSRKFYEGSWDNGVQNGEGTLYGADGGVLKKGLWANGAFERVVHQ